MPALPHCYGWVCLCCQHSESAKLWWTPVMKIAWQQDIYNVIRQCSSGCATCNISCSFSMFPAGQPRKQILVPSLSQAPGHLFHKPRAACGQQNPHLALSSFLLSSTQSFRSSSHSSQLGGTTPLT